MSSSAFKFVKLAFRSRQEGESSSSAQPDAGPSTISPSPREPPPSYMEQSRGSFSSDSGNCEGEGIAKDFDGLSITSTRPPTYRSETTVTALPDWTPMPLIVGRECLPDRLALDLLPVPLLENIASYLPISSQICLRYTCKTIFYSLSIGTSASLLGFEQFLKCPKEIRTERVLLLVLRKMATKCSRGKRKWKNTTHPKQNGFQISRTSSPAVLVGSAIKLRHLRLKNAPHLLYDGAVLVVCEFYTYAPMRR